MNNKLVLILMSVLLSISIVGCSKDTKDSSSRKSITSKKDNFVEIPASDGMKKLKKEKIVDYKIADTKYQEKIESPADGFMGSDENSISWGYIAKDDASIVAAGQLLYDEAIKQGWVGTFEPVDPETGIGSINLFKGTDDEIEFTAYINTTAYFDEVEFDNDEIQIIAEITIRGSGY